MTPPPKGRAGRKAKQPITPLIVSPKLTHDPAHDRIAETYVGQAHIAKTGPEGVKCGDCRYWHNWKTVREGSGSRTVADRDDTAGGALCNKPIANKPRKKFPASADACMFFEEA